MENPAEELTNRDFLVQITEECAATPHPDWLAGWLTSGYLIPTKGS